MGAVHQSHAARLPEIEARRLEAIAFPPVEPVGLHEYNGGRKPLIVRRDETQVHARLEAGVRAVARCAGA